MTDNEIYEELEDEAFKTIYEVRANSTIDRLYKLIADSEDKVDNQLYEDLVNYIDNISPKKTLDKIEFVEETNIYLTKCIQLLKDNIELINNQLYEDLVNYFTD